LLRRWRRRCRALPADRGARGNQSSPAQGG
jgi:hypothetical protein